MSGTSSQFYVFSFRSYDLSNLKMKGLSDWFCLQLALKAGVFYDKVSNMTIWGNHSTTQVIQRAVIASHLSISSHILQRLMVLLQVPDFLNAKINGVPVKEVIKDNKWLEEEFTAKVQQVNFRAYVYYHCRNVVSDISVTAHSNFIFREGVSLLRNGEGPPQHQLLSRSLMQ